MFTMWSSPRAMRFTSIVTSSTTAPIVGDAVGSEQHEVLLRAVGNLDSSAHQILEGRDSGRRERNRTTCGRFGSSGLSRQVPGYRNWSFVPVDANASRARCRSSLLQ